MHERIEIFLDESGDLGFSSTGRSSKYFVIAALAIGDSRDMGRIPKKVRRKFDIKGVGLGELKFNKSNEGIRNFILERIGGLDCYIAWVAIEKINVYKNLKLRKDNLYNYLAGLVLGEIFGSVNANKFIVTIDKSSRKLADRNNFDHYIQQKVIEKHSGMFVPELSMSHFDSTGSPQLQVHDFVVGSVFQKMERDDDTYYSKIQEKVIFGKTVW